MPVRFQVHRSVVLEDRKLLALRGEVLEGMPRVGMTASAEDDGEEFTEAVHGVEFVSDGAGGSEPALTFYYGDREKLEAWKAVDWPGTVLSLAP